MEERKEGILHPLFFLVLCVADTSHQLPLPGYHDSGGEL